MIDNLFHARLRRSQFVRNVPIDDFYSDRSRIIFCSSFRRMMKKAQVFSLEANTSVRNRLTHSLEVSDIGRTLTRTVGKKLERSTLATSAVTECFVAIVENACLLHDIGNPPFGHFGEAAISSWFSEEVPHLFADSGGIQASQVQPYLSDFLHFDGNPQGFRIATRLHTELDEFSLNLTCSTLLATIKYPFFAPQGSSIRFGKKQGLFESERERYDMILDRTNATPGKRYFLVYLMELADDICYCLSDIADSFEKKVTTAREFDAEMRKICDDEGVDAKLFLPSSNIQSFQHEVAIKVSRMATEEAAEMFASKIESYLAGDADELSSSIQAGKILECLKKFSRKFIYTWPEAQRMEIAGSRIVRGLLDHYGMLLKLSRSDFDCFVEQGKVPKGSGLDLHWRVFNQLSPRMVKAYSQRVEQGVDDIQEWIARAHLIVDFISGMTDDSARDVYQNMMGISV